MMADISTRAAATAAPRRGAASTRPGGFVHPPVHLIHPARPGVPGIPGSAAPGVDGPRRGVHPRPRPVDGVHPHPGPVHPPRPDLVHLLVIAARWACPVGGAVLLAGGVYAGPASVVPAPVVLALAALAWAVPAGGAR